MGKIVFHMVLWLTLAFLILSCCNSHSSITKNVEGVVWEKVFGTKSTFFSAGGFESGKSVQQTTDGGYVIVGSTMDKNWDIWLLKTDAHGNKLWSKTLGGEFADYGHCAQQISDGGYIVVGSTMYGTSWEDVYQQGGNQVWLVKTDVDGNELWNKMFGGNHSDVGYSVQQTPDGGYIIVGETYSYGAGRSDIWLIKTDADGDELWNKTFGGADTDAGYCVQKTTDGGYILVGETRSYGAGSSDVWLIKTDDNGNELWNRTYGGTGTDIGRFVQQTSDDGYILVGETNSYGAGGSDIWLIKTDADGNESWSKAFGSDISDTANCVRQTMDGGYVMTGSIGSRVGKYDTTSDVALIKVDSNGNTLWDLHFGGSSYDAGQSLVETTDGSYVITGYTFKKISGLAGLSCANMDRTEDERLFLVKFARHD